MRPAFTPPPKYPPTDPGIPCCDTESIVASQQDLVARLRRAVSCSDEVFEARYLRPLHNLARYIHLLPASSHEHFAGPGGLFRLCCEIGFFCAQAADERIYTPSADVETRHALEPRYKYATYLAGLVCEIYRPLALATITDDAGAQWPKFLMPLDDWIAQERVSRYFVSWPETPRPVVPGAEGSAVIGGIWPKDQMTWLDQGSPTILRDAYSVALGQARAGDSILADVVDSIRARVLRHDELTRRNRYGRLRSGHHIELHLIDAMRERIARQQWKVHNGADGPLWYGSDGLYVAWPEACADMLADIDAAGLQGLPRNPLTIAEALGHAGLLVQADSGQWQWTLIVSPPDEPGEPLRRTALRIRDAGALLGYITAKPKERPYAEYLVERTGGPEKPAQETPEAEAIARTYTLTATQEPSEPAATQSATEVPAAQASLMPADASQDKTAANSKQAPARTPKAESAGGSQASPARPAAEPRNAMQAPATPAAQAPAKLSPAAHVPEALRKTLKDAEAEMVGRWVERFRAGRVEAVVELSGRAIAISQDTLADDDLDLSTVVSAIDKRGWLASIPGQARGMRAGPVQFGDKSKIGFVLNASAAKALGFFPET